MKKYLYLLVSLLFATFTLSYGNTIVDNKGKPIITSPHLMGMDQGRLERCDEIIENSIKVGEIPGAVLAVVRGDKLVYLKAYGHKSLYPTKEKMEVETIFDLASVSKSAGTAVAMMQLLEQGYFRLTDNVNLYIKGFKGYRDGNGKERPIRIVDLLTHSSGLPAYAPVEEIVKKHGSPSPEGLKEYLSNCERDFAPTTQFRYSCLNFITLQFVLESITGTTLSNYVEENVLKVLEMESSCYNPPKEMLHMVAPTEKQPDGSYILGKVHDPMARILNDGNSGNAGLFSNAIDLSKMAVALMNGGVYNGKRVLGPLTIELMRRVPKEVEQLGRSLGWDNYSPYASNNGNIFHSTESYGHTGYTGTSFIIDPVNQVSVILLAHRVHPVDKGSVVRLRALVANTVAGAVIEE